MQSNALIQHLEKLYYFVTVADSGSLLAAAKKLRIAQPSLSHSMSILEQALGVTLFERSRSGVKLSLAGSKIYDFSQKLLIQSQDVLDDLDTQDNALAGKISVCSYDFLASGIWPVAHKKMLQNCPELRLSYRTEVRSSQMMNQLISGEIDVAILAEPSLPKSLVKTKVFEDYFSFFATAKYLKNFEKKPNSTIHVDDLNAADLIYIPHTMAAQNLSVEDLLLTEGIHTKPAHEIFSYAGIIALAMQDLGIAILPSFLSSFHDSQKKLIKLKTSFKNEIGRHQFFLVCKQSRAQDPRLVMLSKILRNFQ